MTNHYHLLLQTGSLPLADLMRPLNSRYARYYAKKHGRRGYLFQDRFKSIATQDQRYVREIVRYIHGNPLRAGICRNLRDLSRYRWCSHGTLLGLRESELVDPRIVLQRFGRTKTEARHAYLEYMGQAKEQPDMELLKIVRMNNEGKADIHNAGGWVIGDPEFVKSAMLTDKANRIRLARYQKEGVQIAVLGRRFAKAAGISEAELLRRSRGTERAALRQVFSHLCRKEYGFRVKDVADYFGIDEASASVSVQQGGLHIAKGSFNNLVI